MKAKAEYIPNCYVCNKCGSRMEILITPELMVKDLMKLICPKCNNK